MNVEHIGLLYKLIASGSGSLLQYVSESFPYTSDASHGDLDRVRELAHEERREVARLTRLLQKMHFRSPRTEMYPSHFTSMNFCTLDYIVPKLIAEHQREIAAIGTETSHVVDEDVGKIAESYLAMKRRHLQILTELGSLKKVAATA